jgi:peptidoglycan/LPS O-acetylase OafA/YrhL
MSPRQAQQPALQKFTRIPELDGLRALAVLSVIASHYWPEQKATWWGWMGVDLFFVLSGYLITGILLDTRGSASYFGTFYARRLLRILPPYYLLLALYACSVYSYEGRSFSMRWLAFAMFLNSYFDHGMLLGWFPRPPAVLLGLGVLWSLSVEEQFYLLWAPIIRYVRGRSLNWIVAGSILLCPILRSIAHKTGEAVEYFRFPHRLDALMFGAAVVLFLRSKRFSLQKKARLLSAAVPVSLAALIWFSLATNLADRTRIDFARFGYSLVGIACASLVGYAVVKSGRRSLVCEILRNRILRAVGRVSYVAYLIHLPVRYEVNLLIASAGVTGLSRKILSNLTGLVVTFVIADLSWNWLERPTLRLKDRYFPPLDPKPRAQATPSFSYPAQL